MGSTQSRLGWLASLALLAAPAAAQDALTPLRKQAEFLRKVAGELGFVELALDEVARLVERSGNDAERQMLQALEVEILLEGAGRAEEIAERRHRYARGFARAEELLGTWQKGPSVLAVHRLRIAALVQFDRVLSDDIEIAALESPARKVALEKVAGELYRRGVESCEAVLAELGTRPAGRDSAEHSSCSACKARFLLGRARAVPHEREALCGQARSTLEEGLLGGCDGEISGLWRLLELAKIQLLRGQHDEAARDFQHSVEAAYAHAIDPGRGPVGVELEITVQFMEESYERLTATLLAQGRPGDVLRAAAQYRKRLAEIHGVPGHEDPRLGALVRLAEAEALLATGQRAKALAIARSCLEAHREGLIAARARALLDRRIPRR